MPMRTCFQMAGLDMLAHGMAVHEKFLTLYEALRDEAPLPDGWRLPGWLTPEAGKTLLARLPSLETLYLYHRYHDCGKPLVRTVDAEGRQHFPDHARASEQAWLAHGGSKDVGTLIGMDMDVHCLKAEEVAEFAARPQAAALLLTGLAEIHANADLFGGIDSTSFKIKLKQLDRRGKQIIQYLQESPSCKN